MRKLLLIRHPSVCRSVKDRCYGRSDVPLGDEGLKQIPSIVERVKRVGTPDCLIHSGVSRTRILSNALVAGTAIPEIEEPRLLERNFGDWELELWDRIYEQYGDAMLGMVRSPRTWAPPNGETTFEMRDRVIEWFSSLPAAPEFLVAVTHGGPIASLLGTLSHRTVEEWLELVPPVGSCVLVYLNMETLATEVLE